MPQPNPSTSPRGVVVVHAPPDGGHAAAHERITLFEIARRLAALLDYEAGGTYEASKAYAGHRYFLPSSTLAGADAAALGIGGPQDLFGGVVPHAFVGTKAISHPLVAPGAARPPGWNPRFSEQVGDAVLAGYAAFGLPDALDAGTRLLHAGPVRIKPAGASGGHGQRVVRSAAELRRELEALDPHELEAQGVVLEEDLQDVRTLSIGQVTLPGLSASYYGVQHLTRNNAGHEVFGGSALTVVRGDFGALAAADLAPEVRHAVAQARRFDAAVEACYPGFYASRRNYDIVLGRDARGNRRSAVLEQSWRAGGATGPEIAALEAFHARPGLACVATRGYEVFGDAPDPPPHATVYFRGVDPLVGRLTKYTVVQTDVDAGPDD